MAPNLDCILIAKDIMKYQRDCFLDCVCCLDEHAVRFSYDTFPDDSDPPELTVHTQLYQYDGFFRRLWEAIRYLFKREARDGHWCVTIIEPHGAKILRDYLDKFIEEDAAWYKEHAPLIKR